MSFTPRSRLITDSHRSPRVAASAATSPKSTLSARLTLDLLQGAMNPTTPTGTSNARVPPPARPSNVLLGLAFDIGRLPRLRPTKNAPTSYATLVSTAPQSRPTP